MNQNRTNRALSINPAHLMVLAYLGLAVTAVLFLAPPMTELPGQLVTFAARYTSLFLSLLPFLAAAAIWTAVANLIPHRLKKRSGLTADAAAGAFQPLPLDPRMSPLRLRTPVAIAASGAFHPVTIIAVALGFGVNSGLFLFFVVFSVIIVAVAGVAEKKSGCLPQPATSDPSTTAQSSEAPRSPIHATFDRWRDLASSELYHRLRFTALGLLVAVAAHVLIPETLIRLFGSIPVLSVIAMALLAFVLSIPPEAAPFAAALFFGRVSHGGVLAFVLVSAIVHGRGSLVAARATRARSVIVFSVTALLLIIVVTLPIGNLAAGALW